MMAYKAYLSDEGFGHLVRQRAIYDEIRKLDPTIKATVQTGSREGAAKRFFSEAQFIDKFNNIAWPRNSDGSPNIEAIRCFFQDYIDRSKAFIEAEENLGQYDFILSDFVCEAFPLARLFGIPSFGVAHFTWDWFFSKLYPAPVNSDVMEKLRLYANQADTLYFPPFTPEEILRVYHKIARTVPFIVNHLEKYKSVEAGGKFTVMIMDSGAEVLNQHIETALKTIGKINDIHFVIAEKYGLKGDNISVIPNTDYFSDYIPNVDLVITRGGFNTISECIAYRIPILLLGEGQNPEIERNLFYIKQEGLGSFISLDRFVYALEDSLHGFIEAEYTQIRKRIEEHEYRSDGASVIAEDIMNRVKH